MDVSEKPTQHDSREVPGADEKAAPRAVAPLPVYQRSSQRTSYDYIDRSAGSSHDHDGLRLALSVLAGIVIALGFAYGAWTMQTPVWTHGDSGPQEPQVQVVAAESDADAAAPTTIDICMVGDVLLHPSVYSSGRTADGSYDFSYLFANVSDEVAA